MDIVDISNVVTTLLIIVIIIFVIMFGSFLIVKHRDDTRVRAAEAMEDVRKYRMKRNEHMKQVLQVFGDGNPYAEKLEKLASLYSKVDSKEREIAWEEKYVSVMHAFMQHAAENTPPQLLGSYNMANNALIADEQALDAARTEYEVARKTLDIYVGAPMKYLVAAGDKLFAFTRKSTEASYKIQDTIGQAAANKQAQRQEEQEKMDVLNTIIALEREERREQVRNKQ